MAKIELPLVQAWRKSSHSADSAACVEIGHGVSDDVFVRDSKDPDGPVLKFTAKEWVAFITGVQDGEFGP